MGFFFLFALLLALDAFRDPSTLAWGGFRDEGFGLRVQGLNSEPLIGVQRPFQVQLPTGQHWQQRCTPLSKRSDIASLLTLRQKKPEDAITQLRHPVA